MTLASQVTDLLAQRASKEACPVAAPLSDAETVPAEEARARPSQATRLVDLTRNAGAELWHDGAGDPFITVPVDGHREHHKLASKAIRDWLARQYYEQARTAPGSQALADAITVLSGLARFEGPTHATAVRVGGDGSDDVFLDLGDASWRAIRVTAHGWEVVTDPAVRFIRSRGMRPLPEPTRGGSLDPLRDLLHVDAAECQMLTAWILGAFCPRGPYPLLALAGEQGSGKSTRARLVRRLIDPHLAELRAEPHAIEDLMIAAVRSRVVVFDNLSSIPPWLSDALCRLSTGGAMTKRELYTNDEEVIVEAMRPVIITAIADVITRGDLLDRAIAVTAPALPESACVPEAELWRQFGVAAPGMLGALLDAVATALLRQSTIALTDLPRMADWAVWVTAAEPALDLPDGSLLTAYRAMRGMAVEVTLDGDPLAVAIRALPRPWTGNAGDLLARVTANLGRIPRGWPESPRGMSAALRRLAPGLRRVGIAIEFRQEHGSNGRRLIDLVTADKDAGMEPTQSTQPSHTEAQPFLRPCDGSDGCDGLPADSLKRERDVL